MVWHPPSHAEQPHLTLPHGRHGPYTWMWEQQQGRGRFARGRASCVRIAGDARHTSACTVQVPLHPYEFNVEPLRCLSQLWAVVYVRPPSHLRGRSSRNSATLVPCICLYPSSFDVGMCRSDARGQGWLASVPSPPPDATELTPRRVSFISFRCGHFKYVRRSQWSYLWSSTGPASSNASRFSIHSAHLDSRFTYRHDAPLCIQALHIRAAVQPCRHRHRCVGPRSRSTERETATRMECRTPGGDGARSPFARHPRAGNPYRNRHPNTPREARPFVVVARGRPRVDSQAPASPS